MEPVGRTLATPLSGPYTRNKTRQCSPVSHATPGSILPKAATGQSKHHPKSEVKSAGKPNQRPN